MNQEAYSRSGVLAGDVPNHARRFLPVVLLFAIAFTIDQITGQRYSSVWGSAAIIASVVSLFPAIRLALVAFGGYAAIWVGFNLVRAVADNASPGLVGTEVVSNVESAMFGGQLPSAYLQSQFFDAGRVDSVDVALAIVHGSFFVTPFLTAGLVWWTRRSLFPRYAGATAVTFALGFAGFLLLPTAPPWLSEPGDVTRVTHHVLKDTAGLSLADNTGDTASMRGFWFEPNHLAAVPSVHVASVVLVFLVLRQFGRASAIAGALYATAMTISVVYLGEHFIIDVVLGWGVALAGWQLTRYAGRLRRAGIARFYSGTPVSARRGPTCVRADTGSAATNHRL